MNGMEFNGQKLLVNLPWSSEGKLGARSPYNISTDFPVRLFESLEKPNNGLLRGKLQKQMIRRQLGLTWYNYS